MADTEIKRLNYFVGQFLDEKDFTDEQQYHIAMRRRLNKALRGPGILDGGFEITVTQATANTAAKITVGAGLAVDNQGRELVVLTPLEKEISQNELAVFYNKTVMVYLGYHEEATDNKTADENTSGNTRVTENPVIALTTDQLLPDSILLAKVTIDGTGNISSPDKSRQLSSLFVGGAVGIGTVDVKRTLHVQGHEIHSGGQGAGFSFSNRQSTNLVETPTAGERWVWYAHEGKARLWSGSDKLSVTAEGNIGIGTIKPTAKLEVVGGGGGTIDLKVSGRLQSNNNDGGLWVSDDRFIGGYENKVGFWNGGAWRLTVHNNGYVGIGTQYPDRTLDIAGTVRATDEIQTTSANAFRMVQGAYGVFFRNDNTNTYLLLTNAWDPYGSWNNLRPLTINNASGEVYLGNLDVADNFTATVRCGDFKIGHPSRRGAPGRALVDYGDTLHVNYNGDWANVTIRGNVKTPSSRQLKENIQTLSSQVAKRVISTLEPVTFFYKQDAEKSLCLGFIAEDSPAEVASSNHDAIIINHIVSALTRVVKDQQQSIEKLEAQVDLLRNNKHSSKSAAKS
jgi:hypothetical protein